MRKIDKRIKQAGLLFFLALCGAIFFCYILFNGGVVIDFLKKLILILMPFIYGFFIAYILNPIMDFFESKIVYPLYSKIVKSKKSNKKPYRFISVILAIGFFLLFVYALIIMIVPQVIESIQSIISRCPAYINTINIWVNDVISNNTDLAKVLSPYTANVEEWVINNVLPALQSWISNISSNIIGGVYSTITQLIKFIIGIIIASFLLANKEVYCAQAKKIVYAALREERANNLINNARFANKTFGGFLNGKIIDSFIIGCLSFIVITICQIPYALLVSVIIGITNIIPYFGPFLGAIPTVLIVLMVDPKKALLLIVVIFIIQQIDGNIIGPKILGDSTGLSSFWVIFAITVFGGFFGVFGMFIGVPVFAVIYAAIRTFVNERLKKKQLPDATSYYLDSDYHSDDDNTNTGKEIKFVKKTFENIYVEGKGKQVIVTIDKEETESNNSSDKKK
ncbi:MAG: AI-2E family transporter [Lachnospiraceae bacterium]|nr:AI-2E family transporter [Lachnospiraceae bacterium]